MKAILRITHDGTYEGVYMHPEQFLRTVTDVPIELSLFNSIMFNEIIKDFSGVSHWVVLISKHE